MAAPASPAAPAWRYLLAVAALSLAFAWWLHGPRVILPGSHDWLLHGDPAQHYLGSVFFIAEPWHWPPGLIARFGEAPTSVVFTDSIPLLALLAKALGWPAGWQYFGAWMVACHVLMGVFALRLLHRLAGDAAASRAQIPAALFFVFAPALLLRIYGHEALMAQFLVLAALERALAPWRFGPWLLLVAVAVLVHPYLAVMCAVIGLGAAIAALSQRQVSWAALAGQGVTAALVLTATAWVAGYFVGAGQVSAAGHGFFSANALTWIDPMDWAAFTRTHQRAVPYDAEWSRFLPAQAQATGGQYEGFAYLGAGMLLLIGVALLLSAWPARRPQGDAAAAMPAAGMPATVIPPAAIPATATPATATPATATPATATPATAIPASLWITTLLLALWAWSLRPSIGARVLADIPVTGALESFLGTFRASGRFIWPLTYLVMAWALSRVLRGPPHAHTHTHTHTQARPRWPRTALVLIILSIVLQRADLLPKLRELRTRLRIGPPGIEQPVDTATLRPLLSACPRLHIVSEALPPEGWIHPTLAAALAGAQVDPAPTARRSPQMEQAHRDAARQLLATQGWRADTVYLLAQPLPGTTLDAVLQGLPATHAALPLQDRTLVVPRACERT